MKLWKRGDQPGHSGDLQQGSAHTGTLQASATTTSSKVVVNEGNFVGRGSFPSVKRCSIMRVTESIEAWPQIARYCSAVSVRAAHGCYMLESSVRSGTNHFFQALMCFIY